MLFSPITSEDYLERIVETKNRMRTENMDLLIVFSDSWRSANCRYLTGIKPYPALARDYWGIGYAPVSLITIPLEEDPTVFISDLMYEYAKREIAGTLREKPWIDVKPWTKTKSFLRDLGEKVKNIGFEGKDIIPWPVYEIFREAVGSEMKDTEILELQRRIKSEREIKLMEVASNINDRICEELVRGIIRKGVTEREIERKIKMLGHSMDAEYVDANFMQSRNVGFGHSTDATIEDGSLLSLHVILQYEGYNSDNDRIFGFGNIGEEEKELAKITNEAFEKGLSTIKPGIKGSEAPKAALDTHEFVALGKEGGAGTYGHGIGLEGEELGFIDDWILKKGMTFAFATGAYNKDFGAAWATEDVIVVTESGARSLTKFDRDFIIH